MQRLESQRGRGLACEGEVEVVFAFNEKSINVQPCNRTSQTEIEQNAGANLTNVYTTPF